MMKHNRDHLLCIFTIQFSNGAIHVRRKQSEQQRASQPDCKLQIKMRKNSGNNRPNSFLEFDEQSRKGWNKTYWCHFLFLLSGTTIALRAYTRRRTSNTSTDEDRASTVAASERRATFYHQLRSRRKQKERKTRRNTYTPT